VHVLSEHRKRSVWFLIYPILALAKETLAFCRFQGLTRDETRITKTKVATGEKHSSPARKEKTMPKTHSKNKRPSNREKHSRAQGSKANQAKVNAWKEYKNNGGTLSLTAWAKQHW
jgi:hypothetical protein